MLIRTEYLEDGKVAVLALCHPPVNSLSAALREALGQALEAVLSDAGVAAVVLTGEGSLFCGGAEIREFNTPLPARLPTLRDLIARIERAGKPVVAAIHGTALGGGGPAGLWTARPEEVHRFRHRVASAFCAMNCAFSG